MTRLLVFDSGIGGLSVAGEIRLAMPAAEMVYVADDAGFPYGERTDDDLTAHVVELIGALIGLFEPDAVVIACHTASTLVLPPLRDRFPIPFVGTVPAIKPAAERTRSGLISVLATPGTMRRDYTRALIESHASHCAVRLVGSANLAPIAEAFMRGEPVDDAAISAEIASGLRRGGRRPAHRYHRPCLHPLSLPQGGFRPACPVAGGVDRSGAGDRTAGGQRRRPGRRRRQPRRVGLSDIGQGLVGKARSGSAEARTGAHGGAGVRLIAALRLHPPGGGGRSGRSRQR